MKKVAVLFTCLLLMISLTGCSKMERNNIDLSDVQTSEEYIVPDSIKKMEVMNIYNDTQLYLALRENASKELEKLKTSSDSDEIKLNKAYIIINDIIFEMYKISNTRISTDIETIYTNSEEYMTYVAMLQVFVDNYSEEKEEIQSLLLSGSKETLDMKSYKAFLTVEEYYISILKSWEETEESNTDDKTSVETSNKDESKNKEDKKETSSTGSTLDDLINSTK